MGLTFDQVRHKVAAMLRAGEAQKVESIWTEDRLARLLELYWGGWHYPAISRELGMSYKQVRRKVERMQHNGQLALRPKPPTVPKQRSERPRRAPRVKAMKATRTPRASVPIVRLSAPASIANGLPIPRARTCQWPFGEPREPGFRFCDAPDVVPGRSYCQDHTREAYCGYADGNLAWWVRGPSSALGVYGVEMRVPSQLNEAPSPVSAIGVYGGV
jgi:GcrA cell cycle regulator